MKKSTLAFLISSLLGSFFYMIIGWLVFDRLLGSYTESQTTQILGFKKTTDFSFLFLYLSCLAYSVLINFILSNSKITSLASAFLFSSAIGFLVACMTDFYWYASSNFYTNFSVVCLDILAAAITVGCLGGFNFLLINQLTKK